MNGDGSTMLNSATASTDSAESISSTNTDQTPRLEIRNLSKQLPSGGKTLTILADINLAIAPGEFIAILGPSGSGKSTLLALMAGLDRPTTGEVLIDGSAIQNQSEDQLAILRRRNIGFVFQSFQLLDNLTAHENVMLPIELAGLPDARERAASLLDSVGLAERRHHYPVQLSGGEQQRVALARAFAPQPAILLADEPTGNLDSHTGADVLKLLLAMRDEHGSTLVLVTHDPAVGDLADRTVRLIDGRVASITERGATS